MSLQRVILEGRNLLLLQVIVVCAIHAFFATGYDVNTRNKRMRSDELWGSTDTSNRGREVGGNNFRRYHPNSLDQGPRKEDMPLGLMTFFGSPTSKPEAPPAGSAWDGKWFPTTPGLHHKKELGKDEHGRIQMGVSSSECDDGKTNLTIDWDESPSNYTCFHPETRYPMGELLEPIQNCVTIPDKYRPDHFCMNQTIEYNHNTPTYGDHRPLWPAFGEYLFVPRQRWLHNIEHGAVVMLYHPCAHPMEVKLLKRIVRGCLGKHIITPSNLLSHERPLALVAWGCRLEMSTVDTAIAQDFIRQKSLHGPEGNYTKEGQFFTNLIHFSNETGDANYDRVTC